MGEEPDGATLRRNVLLASVAAVTIAVAFGLAARREVTITFLRDAALIFALGLSGWGFGEPVRRRLADEVKGLAGALTAGALGLGAIAVALFLLGLAHALSRTSVALLVLAGATLGVGRLVRNGGPPPLGRRRPSFETSVLGAAAFAVATVTFAGALVPEIFYDALYYHDALPALFLRRGAIEIFPYAVHSAMPLYLNLVDVPLLAFGGASTVKLAHAAFFLGTCLWIFVIARRAWGARAGLVSALAFGALPGVGIMAGFGGVDLGVAFFCIGAVDLITLRLFHGTSRRVVAAAGALLGLAAGSKLTALLPVIVIVAATCAGPAGDRHGRLVRLGDAAIAGGVAAIVAAPWYVRSLILLGNPIYPLLSAPGTRGTWADTMVRLAAGTPYQWSELWRVPLDMVFEWRRFGAGGELWPALWFIVVAVFWGLTQRGFARWVSVLTVVILLGWARSSTMARFAYPGIATGAVLVGGMFARIAARSTFFRIATLAMAIAAGVGAARQHAIQRALYGGAFEFLAGGASVQDFLDARLPDARAARWVRVGTDECRTRLLLVGETTGYYFDRDYEPVSAYDRHPLVEWVALARSADDLRGLLIAHGFTHIVWNHAELQRLNESYRHLLLDADGWRRLREVLAGSARVYADENVVIFGLLQSASQGGSAASIPR